MTDVIAHPKVRTCLWFDGNGEEAAETYVALLSGSSIKAVSRPEPNQPALVVELQLSGTPYMFLNGDPHFQLSPASPNAVRTSDQDETDRVWYALTANQGEESRCAGRSLRRVLADCSRHSAAPARV